MLSIVHGYERPSRPELFDAMFRHRKTVFIDQKKWDLKAVDGEFEIDEFDRDDTVYLCSLLPDGSLAGSIRFLNTTTDHMAGSVFQPMFPGLTVRSPTIWEATRFAVPEDKRLQPNGVSRAACEIIVGMCLFGLEYGVTQMTAIYEAGLERVFKKCGLTHYVLGRHRSEEHGAVHYGLCEVSRELEASIRSATQLMPYETVENVAVAAE
ncbi:acyl-homoserine-lactone synthase [Methylocapsa aurea]|uniref:acyl-homoserine-lactone synthase n=1 Tax=Methylocapsa aurea TaxID=663610 RepID=UPI00055E79FD|nr:acyl-homoserine-lactone synthase [Methylocapsa aurea]